MVRPDLQRLIDAVSGRTVFIIGGGPSVSPEMIATLNDSGALCFGLNSSAKFIKSPVGVLWTDNSWGAKNKPYLDKLVCPKFFVTTSGRNYIKKDIKTQSNATVVHKSGESGFDNCIDHVKGNNSGAFAINLLVNCGAKRLGLVGYDMHTEKGRAHFHNEYDYAIRPEVYKNHFIPCIEAMAEVIKSSGYSTKIYNCNPFSSLKCFDFRSIGDII